MEETLVSRMRRLPEELRFEILNILLAKSPVYSRHFAFKSRSDRVRRIGLQHLVSHMVFTTDIAVVALAHYLDDPPPIIGYDPASTIHSILLAPPTDYATGYAINIINHCPNITRIALSYMRFRALFNPGSIYCYSNIVPAILPQRGSNLEVTILDSPQRETLVPSPSIANITHLHFAAAAPSSFPCFALVSLTHLAMPIPPNSAPLYEFLAIPTLKYFVLLLPLKTHAPNLSKEMSSWIIETRRCDSRVLLLEYDSAEEKVYTEWENQARGFSSIWQRSIRFTKGWEEQHKFTSGISGVSREGPPTAMAARKAYHFQQLENLRQSWPGTHHEHKIDACIM